MQLIYTHQTEEFIVLLWKFDFDKQTSSTETRSYHRNFLIHFLPTITKNHQSRLYFNDNGKPFIEGAEYKSISISHTLNYLAIQLRKDIYAGIDIEIQRNQLVKVQHKFLNEQEITNANSDLNLLCCFWTSKEATFKIYGHQSISLKEHIRIVQYDLPIIYVDIRLNSKVERFELHSHYLHPLNITYVVKKIEKNFK